MRKDVKRLRSDLNETTNDTASYEGIFSGVEPVAGGAAPTAPKDAIGAPPAGAPENLKGGSTDSTAGRIGGLSMAGEEEVAPATAAGSVPNGNGAGSGSAAAAAADSLSTQPPPAKRLKPARAAAAVEIAATAGERELREQLSNQNRLLAEMAKELEELRRERTAVAAGGSAALNGGGGGGGGGTAAGEGLAALPVSFVAR